MKIQLFRTCVFLFWLFAYVLVIGTSMFLPGKNLLWASESEGSVVNVNESPEIDETTIDIDYYRTNGFDTSTDSIRNMELAKKLLLLNNSDNVFPYRCEYWRAPGVRVVKLLALVNRDYVDEVFSNWNPHWNLVGDDQVTSGNYMSLTPLISEDSVILESIGVISTGEYFVSKMNTPGGYGEIDTLLVLTRDDESTESMIGFMAYLYESRSEVDIEVQSHQIDRKKVPLSESSSPWE